MIVIYPSDPSTRFLNPIVQALVKANIISPEINTVLPDTYEAARDLIQSTINLKTIVFLGHGSSFELSGGCYIASGRQAFISVKQAKEILKDKKLICLSCRSSEFISSFDGVYKAALGFGNIVTAAEDLIGQKEKRKYRDPNSINIFRERLVISFTNAIIEAYKSNYTFEQFYYGLKLRINKAICEYSLSENPNEHLAGELMYDLKTNMKLFGNGNELI